MAKPAPTYDLMLMLDATVDEELRTKILSDTEAIIGKGGTLSSRSDYGKRTLAYEIDKKPDADYHLLQFQGPTSVLKDLDRTLRITDGVVRFRVIKLAPGTPEAPDLSAPLPPMEGTTAPEEEQQAVRL